MTALAPRRSVAMLAVGLSTVVEWYDFTLCLYFAPTLSRVFFGQDDMALGKTLAGFAIAYLMRPFGAVLFGLFGDRHGRRPTLLMSMAAMTLTMLCLALLPTYAQVGALAGAGLILMRCMMGLSVGGEYTAVVAYLFESAPFHRRGFDHIPCGGGERDWRLVGCRFLRGPGAQSRCRAARRLGMEGSVPVWRRAGGRGPRRAQQHCGNPAFRGTSRSRAAGAMGHSSMSCALRREALRWASPFRPWGRLPITLALPMCPRSLRRLDGATRHRRWNFPASPRWSSLR